MCSLQMAMLAMAVMRDGGWQERCRLPDCSLGSARGPARCLRARRLPGRRKGAVRCVALVRLQLALDPLRRQPSGKATAPNPKDSRAPEPQSPRAPEPQLRPLSLHISLRHQAVWQRLQVAKLCWNEGKAQTLNASLAAQTCEAKALCERKCQCFLKCQGLDCLFKALVRTLRLLDVSVDSWQVQPLKHTERSACVKPRTFPGFHALFATLAVFCPFRRLFVPSASPATSSSPGRLPAKSALRLCALPVLKGGDVDGPADGYGGAAERCEGLWKAPGNEFFLESLA